MFGAYAVGYLLVIGFLNWLELCVYMPYFGCGDQCDQLPVANLGKMAKHSEFT